MLTWFYQTILCANLKIMDQYDQYSIYGGVSIEGTSSIEQESTIANSGGATNLYMGVQLHS